MAAPTFFWHDYETFGRSARLDRPAQFAGVRTNLELEQLADPVMVHCHPPADVLPDPEACLLTGIAPQRCQALGVPEHRFADEVERHLALPSTIGAGFNSIAFDDEFTRFLFWRNLIDPYAREWRKGCGRWDLLGVVRCAYALRPEGISWPTVEGRPTFRLQELSAANGLVHDSAHDALSDVRATLALARLIKEAQPRLWEFCLKLRDRTFVQSQLEHDRPAIHVSARYPVERGCLAVIWPLANHPHKGHEVIVWDLTHDPAELLTLSADEMRARLFIRHEDLPPGRTRLPLSTVHKKKSPVVVGNLSTLRPHQAARWGIDMDTALRHAEVAQQVGARLSGIWTDVFARPPGEPADVDEALYTGFLCDEDRRALQHLRSIPAEALARERRPFVDGRLEELVFRYRARNHPQTLDADEQDRWQAHRRARLVGGAHGARTLASFIDEVARLRASADARADAILNELAAWGAQMDRSLSP